MSLSYTLMLLLAMLGPESTPVRSRQHLDPLDDGKRGLFQCLVKVIPLLVLFLTGCDGLRLHQLVLDFWSVTMYGR